jgi:oligopeptide/dipeptide ABC transporter ATP-binding protein
MTQADPDSALMTLRDVGVRFRGHGREVVHAVDGVDLDVRRGETLCIVGESGSGKTTLAQIMTGLLSPTRGVVRFHGDEVAKLSGRRLRAFRRRVQIVFQDPYESLNPRHSAGRIVREPLDTHKSPAAKPDRDQRVLETLAECGLVPPEEYATRWPHQLSGGQRQRVSIAAAVALRPEVIVADEPVSMLDVSIRSGILQLLLDLKRLHQLTLVFITHDLSVAWAIADRVAVMYLGRIMELGPATSVIQDAWHPYTRALVSAVPDMASDGLGEVEIRQTAGAGRPDEGCLFAPRCLHATDACLSQTPSLSPVSNEHISACIRQDHLHATLAPVHDTARARST